MSLSNQARTNRNVELRSKESAVVALYQMQKSDDEIAEALDIAVPLVRATRDGMGLPPLRSASGRLFTPEADAQIIQMRDKGGWSFRTIGNALGYMAMDTEVRYRILKRLERRAPVTAQSATLPCMICHKPFVSEDRRKIRFCLPCRTDIVPVNDGSPYDPDCTSGCYAVSGGVTLPPA